jgi:hypothetical protein
LMHGVVSTHGHVQGLTHMVVCLQIALAGLATLKHVTAHSLQMVHTRLTVHDKNKINDNV